MTEEKLCPIMSRPRVVISPITSHSGVIRTDGEYLCQREKCMAWNSEGQCSVGALRDECPHIDEGSFECEKCEKWITGFCKLIDKEFP